MTEIAIDAMSADEREVLVQLLARVALDDVLRQLAAEKHERPVAVAAAPGVNDHPDEGIEQDEPVFISQRPHRIASSTCTSAQYGFGK